jgi:hypothetical protein
MAACGGRARAAWDVAQELQAPPELSWEIAATRGTAVLVPPTKSQ